MFGYQASELYVWNTVSGQKFYHCAGQFLTVKQNLPGGRAKTDFTTW